MEFVLVILIIARNSPKGGRCASGGFQCAIRVYNTGASSILSVVRIDYNARVNCSQHT